MCTNSWNGSCTAAHCTSGNFDVSVIFQATACDGRVVDRARAWCSMIGVPYFRFSPQLSDEIAMNETTDEKLCKMLWEAKAYMHENASVMREVADLLLKG